MKIRFYVILILVGMFISIFSTPCFAQESIIETVMQYKKSFVSVEALQTNLYKSPKSQAAIDPKTGRIIVARKARGSIAAKTGAGIIISEDGYIATNLHTVFNANKVSIILHDNTKLFAKIVHIAPEDDLCLLKVNAKFDLAPIKIANSNKISLGDNIIHVGNSRLLDETISGGRIKALGRNKSGIVEFISVNINIYEGDSGGPILDAEGCLIGVVSSKVRRRDRLGIAIPSNKIKKLYMDFSK